MIEPLTMTDAPEYAAARLRRSESLASTAVQTLSAIRDRARALYMSLAEYVAGSEIVDAERVQVRTAQRDALDLLREIDAMIAARGEAGR